MKLTLLPLFAFATLFPGCAAEPAAPPPAPLAIPVTIDTVQRSDWPTHLEAGGIVRAHLSAAIASRVMAPIAAIHVQAGDRVRAGTALVALDARELQAHAASASAAWSAAVDSASAAESEAEATAAAARLARATFDRIESLVQKQSATLHERDQAAAELAMTGARVQAAQARIAAARATRDAAGQALTAATIAISYAALAAPFDGVITERRADPGSMAMPGAPLLILEDVGRFRIEAAIDEARAAHIAVGQAVDVRLDSGAEWMQSAIAEIARVDSNAHTFVIKAALPHAATLRSGLFGRVRFAGAPRSTLTAPAAALLRRGQLSFVYVVDRDGLARLRPVTAGPAANGRVEILAGAAAGEPVVLNPPPSMHDGSAVAGAPGAATRAGRGAS